MRNFDAIEKLDKASTEYEIERALTGFICECSFTFDKMHTLHRLLIKIKEDVRQGREPDRQNLEELIASILQKRHDYPLLIVLSSPNRLGHNAWQVAKSCRDKVTSKILMETILSADFWSTEYLPFHLRYIWLSAPYEFKQNYEEAYGRRMDRICFNQLDLIAQIKREGKLITGRRKP